MAMRTKQRARSDEEKRERREAILGTALAMYERDPSFAAFTMAALAEEAGLAKGTPYLYFRTKEELFLALVGRLFGEWFDEVDARLERGRGAWTAERAAEVALASIRGRTTLARLLSILPAIVERNVETGARLEARLPFLAAGEGARLLVHLHALVIGVWQLAEPSPVIRRVMETPELAPARVDFEEDLRLLITA